MRLFLAVAESKSISRAARALKLGQPTVSRRIAEFEALLGETLFERSVEGVTLTTFGEQLVLPARRMSEWAGELTRAAAQAEPSLSGVVRVTAPPLIAMALLPKLARRVSTRYPQLRLEILSTIRNLDLARGEADLAIRSRAPDSPQLRSLHSLRHRQRVYVARRLKRRLPVNPTAADLPWLAWTQELDHVPPNPQLRALIPDFAPALTTDDILVMLQAVRTGVGAMVLADPIARLLGDPRLVPLDLDLGPHASGQTHIVAASSALGIARVRAVKDALVRLIEQETSGA
ncbi:MAG: LysR family transcriptional regulator [Myxococcales bacterium]